MSPEIAPTPEEVILKLHGCAEEFYRFSDYKRADACRDAIAMLRSLAALTVPPAGDALSASDDAELCAELRKGWTYDQSWTWNQNNRAADRIAALSAQLAAEREISSELSAALASAREDGKRMAGVLRTVVENGQALKAITVGPGNKRGGEFLTVLQLATNALALHDELADAAIAGAKQSTQQSTGEGNAGSPNAD